MRADARPSQAAWGRGVGGSGTRRAREQAGKSAWKGEAGICFWNMVCGFRSLSVNPFGGRRVRETGVCRVNSLSYSCYRASVRGGVGRSAPGRPPSLCAGLGPRAPSAVAVAREASAAAPGQAV